MSQGIPFYKYFDDIICISLKSRPDRQEHAISQGKRMGIPFNFYLTDKHPDGGNVGCTVSHIQVIKDSYAKGYNSVMILEDDFCPSPSYFEKKHLENALKFITINKDWEMLQLGYSPLQDTANILGIFKFLTSKYINPSIIKYTGLFTHCYCISRKGMKRFIDYIDNYLLSNPYPPIDKIMCIIFYNNGCCVVPLLVDQKWCISTDNGAVTNSDKIVRNFQCMAETYKVFYLFSLIIVYRVYIVISIVIIILLICYKKK